MNCFYSMRMGLIAVPYCIPVVAAMIASDARLTDYLTLEDTPSIAPTDATLQVELVAATQHKMDVEASSTTVCCRMCDASFAWDSAQTAFQLHRVCFQLRVDELTVVCGAVGAGKTSFMAACLAPAGAHAVESASTAEFVSLFCIGP